jgi:hypothetical protein
MTWRLIGDDSSWLIALQNHLFVRRQYFQSLPEANLKNAIFQLFFFNIFVLELNCDPFAEAKYACNLFENRKNQSRDICIWKLKAAIPMAEWLARWIVTRATRVRSPRVSKNFYHFFCSTFQYFLLLDHLQHYIINF